MAPRAPCPARPARVFDLVVDFSDPPLFGHHQPPQGYWRVSRRRVAASAPSRKRPRRWGNSTSRAIFAYRENLCAHSRSGIEGCNQCIEVCSTEAIASDGDHVKVDPHLCMGCGACASVCPSGAMGFQFPRVADRGAQLKALLSAYREAGGRDACILFHNGTDGRDLLARAAAAGTRPARAGDPARVVARRERRHRPAAGRRRARREPGRRCSRPAPRRRSIRLPCARRWRSRSRSSPALGYAGRHFALIETADARRGHRRARSRSPRPPSPADAGDVRARPTTSAPPSNSPSSTWRSTRRRPVTEIALPAGAPYGEVLVDKAKCTLCLACAGACPESALMDGAEVPMLRFLERNCVQCGLCERTCPEDAITLAPAPAARPGGSRGARAERDAALPLRLLRQALRHEADGRRDAGTARRAFDVRRRRGAAAPADVRRLPRGRHDVRTRTKRRC